MHGWQCGDGLRSDVFSFEKLLHAVSSLTKYNFSLLSLSLYVETGDVVVCWDNMWNEVCKDMDVVCRLSARFLVDY